MPSFPAILPDDPTALEAVIARHEQQARPLKEGTQATIVWHNKQQKNKTPYSIVYLHGFKASQAEGYPLHKTIAQDFGCNLYLARLYGHGLKSDQPFKKFSSDQYIQSALDACRIGQQIGDRVLLMGTSTGGSLALYAAGGAQYRIPVAGLLLYSPLVHMYGISSLLLENRLSRALLKWFPGRNYRLGDPSVSINDDAVWYPSYLLNGALVLGQTIQQLDLFSLLPHIKCPVFIGYYYKSQYKHDRVVSTAAIKRLGQRLQQLSPGQCTLKNFPRAGTHVIGNSLLSNAVEDVIAASKTFLNSYTTLFMAPDKS